MGFSSVQKGTANTNATRRLWKMSENGSSSNRRVWWTVTAKGGNDCGVKVGYKRAERGWKVAKCGRCVKNHMAGQLVHFSFWLASVVPIFLWHLTPSQAIRPATLKLGGRDREVEVLRRLPAFCRHCSASFAPFACMELRLVCLFPALIRKCFLIALHMYTRIFEHQENGLGIRGRGGKRIVKIDFNCERFLL